MDQQKVLVKDNRCDVVFLTITRNEGGTELNDTRKDDVEMSTKEAERRAHQRRMTLTVNEAAERLGIGRNQAYEAVKNGQIPAIRIGKRLLVPEAALERLMNVGAA
jgi:excisionase family DNA binding protein